MPTRNVDTTLDKSGDGRDPSGTASFLDGWDHVFRVGEHTDSSGVKHVFTEEDLAKIAFNYDPNVHEAPLVIGHPETDAPAFGWIEKVKAVGKDLFVKYKDLAPEFVEWVRRGLYKKKSVKLYPDLTLRHVGYLGATPPAVKGLRNFAFADESGKGSIFEFSLSPSSEGEGMPTEKELQDRIAALENDKAQLQTQLSEATAKGKEFAEHLASLTAENKALKGNLESLNANLRNRDHAEFCDRMIAAGKLLPAERGNTIAFMESLAVAAGDMAFGEGRKSNLDYYKQSIEARTPVIQFGEHATRGAAGEAGAGSAAVKLDVKAREIMTADKSKSYAEAFAEAQASNPELANEYVNEVRR
jgi:hypothetical protein